MPVVLCTGNATSGEVEPLRCLELGFAGLLAKPFTSANMRDAVAAALGDGGGRRADGMISPVLG